MKSTGWICSSRQWHEKPGDVMAMRFLFGFLRITVLAAFVVTASVALLLALLLWSLPQVSDQPRSDSLKEKSHAIRFDR